MEFVKQCGQIASDNAIVIGHNVIPLIASAALECLANPNIFFLMNFLDLLSTLIEYNIR
jgi:hypothetical protein